MLCIDGHSILLQDQQKSNSIIETFPQGSNERAVDDKEDFLLSDPNKSEYIVYQPVFQFLDLFIITKDISYSCCDWLLFGQSFNIRQTNTAKPATPTQPGAANVKVTAPLLVSSLSVAWPNERSS